MSELTDLIIQSANGNMAVALMILGLAFVDLIQTRYITNRMRRMSDQIQRIEKRQWNHLHDQDMGPQREQSQSRSTQDD